MEIIVMTDKEKIEELEQRVKRLEDMLDNICLTQAQNVTFENSSFADVKIGGSCQVDFERCSVGAVIGEDIEDAEDRLDELEARIEEAFDRLDG